jgi:leucyl-tRNA synthetase
LKGTPYKKDLIEKFVLYNLLILYPIAPHFSEFCYQKYYTPRKTESIRDVRWPENLNIDSNVLK